MPHVVGELEMVKETMSPLCWGGDQGLVPPFARCRHAAKPRTKVEGLYA